MNLEKDLPEFDELDIEFSKNCETLYDIFVVNFNKRLQVINALRDDLYEWIVNKLKENSEWEITKKVEMENSFPIKRGENFSRTFDKEIYLSTYIDVRRKNEQKLGFVVEIFFDLERFGWATGQYWDYEGEKELFDYNFYQDLKNKINKETDENLKTKVYFPNTEEESDEQKYILIYIHPKIVDRKEVILHYHKLFKDMIIIPMLNHLNKPNR